ncbi:MAG: hypothetical protein U5K76_12830 [Woeseiaceae bacterium]|nr:hypothetical protein [Woeseiaceae bacterium]
MINVVSFYRFVDIAAPSPLRDALYAVCEQERLLGTVLLATEGVNGTLAGSPGGVRRVLGWLRDTLALESAIDARWTEASEPPFRRLRVRVRPEIVTLGRPDIRPQAGTARHLSPAEWNALLDDPDTLLVDTRNHYEVEVGTFAGALDPGTDSSASSRTLPNGSPPTRATTGGGGPSPCSAPAASAARRRARCCRISALPTSASCRAAS